MSLILLNSELGCRILMPNLGLGKGTEGKKGTYLVSLSAALVTVVYSSCTLLAAVCQSCHALSVHLKELLEVWEVAFPDPRHLGVYRLHGNVWREESFKGQR